MVVRLCVPHGVLAKHEDKTGALKTAATLASVAAFPNPETGPRNPETQATNPMSIGMGCMRLSTDPDRDDERSIAVLHAAFDGGVTFLDTADAYGWDHDDAGHNERLIARALASWRGDRSQIVGIAALVAVSDLLGAGVLHWAGPEHAYAGPESS